jgi:hypothetical protein
MTLQGAETWTLQKEHKKPRKFLNVVMGKDGVQLDRTFEKLSITQSHGGQEHYVCNKIREVNFIGNILRMNCGLKHVFEGS